MIMIKRNYIQRQHFNAENIYIFFTWYLHTIFIKYFFLEKKKSDIWLQAIEKNWFCCFQWNWIKMKKKTQIWFRWIRLAVLYRIKLITSNDFYFTYNSDFKRKVSMDLSFLLETLHSKHFLFFFFAFNYMYIDINSILFLT